MISLDTIRSWRICYDRDDPGWLDRAAAGRTEFSIAEVLAAARNDTDRVWVLTRPGVLTRPQLLEWLARLVERALAHVHRPDPRSIAVVAALRADAITPDIRFAADAAAYSTATNAAYSAADAHAADAAHAAADAHAAAAAYAAHAAAAAYAAAANAAYAAADAHAADAADAAERRQQVEDAMELTI